MRKYFTALFPLLCALLVCLASLPVWADSTTVSLTLPKNNEVEKHYSVDLDSLSEAQKQEVQNRVDTAIDEMKAGIAAQSSFNGSATESPNPTVVAVLGENSYLDVELTGMNAAIELTTEGGVTVTITHYTFEVTPYKNNIPVTGRLRAAVRFRLPVTVDGFAYADVTHNSEFLGQYTVQGEAGAKYIEIESDSFSPYGYTLTNDKIENHVPFADDELQYYSITAIAHEGGTVSSRGVFGVKEFSDKYYQITPNAGYAVAHVLVDGVDIGAVSSYQFSHITADHIIEVFFSAIGASAGRANPRTGVQDVQ